MSEQDDVAGQQMELVPPGTVADQAPPEDERVTTAMARAEAGDRLGAIAELGRALDATPDDPGVLAARASLYMTLQRLDEAEADVRRAIRIDAAHPHAQLQLGVLLCRRARWRDAIEPLQRATQLLPNQALAHYQLGEAYNQTDQLIPALTAYENAARLQPENWRAQKGIGIVLDRLGRPTEAAAAYQKAREAHRR